MFFYYLYEEINFKDESKINGLKLEVCYFLIIYLYYEEKRIVFNFILFVVCKLDYILLFITLSDHNSLEELHY